MVKAHGASGSEIFLVADSASAEDVNNGLALSGSNEGLLKSIFNEQRININETWRTCLFKEKAEWSKYKKDKETLYQEMCAKNPGFEEVLINEIEAVNPNILVPLGEYSFRFLSGLRSLYKYRGSILDLRPDLQSHIKDKSAKVIPTFGPSIINEDWTAKSYVSIDFSKIAKYKNYYKKVEPDGILWVARTAEEFQKYLDRAIWKDNYVVFDIETEFGIPTCISFCFDTNEAVCVPLLDESIDLANRTIMWRMVAKVLAAPFLEKVNQNIGYDKRILERFHFKVNGVSGRDTVIRAGLLYPELPKNLGFLTSIYTEMPYHKDEGKNEKDRNKLYLYCAKDSLATRRIFVKQEEEIKELELTDLDQKMQKLFHIYQKMDDKGIQVDEEAKENLIAKYTVMREVHQEVLDELYGRPINVNSFPQINKLMMDLGYPKRASYNEDTIEELAGWPLADQYGPLILKEIIYLRKIRMILIYLNTTLHEDNRWRASYNLSGTENGRTSCNSSIDKMFREVLGSGIVKQFDAGRSLQTITKHGFYIGKEVIGADVRKIFVPSRGRVLCEIDLSGAEARVDAVLANEIDLLPKFEDPGIHKLTGSWLYNCKPEDIKKGSLEYHHSKIFRHASERNIGARHLAQITHKSVKDCEQLLAIVHKHEPNIREVFHKDITNYVRTHRNLVTPHGRRRDFFARADNSMFNEAISYYPQAIVSDQNKFAFIEVIRELNGKVDFDYLNEAHDSSLVEIEIGALELYAKTAVKYLERGIDFRKGSIKRDYELIIPAEVEWSDTNWYEMRALKL